jgi:hypothetical protein
MKRRINLSELIKLCSSQIRLSYLTNTVYEYSIMQVIINWPERDKHKWNMNKVQNFEHFIKPMIPTNNGQEH